MIRIISFVGILFCLPTSAIGDEECVVLLHGLLRVSNSMSELGSKLDRSGYSVVNINYPSRRYEIDVLAADAVGRGLAGCENQGSGTIHFVTHSLGGILVRYYFQQQSLPMLGRVVMLGPPNQGTEIVDGLSPVPGFGMLWGPTGAVLGTGPGSIFNELGPVSFELGVIAGDTNINPVNWFLMEGPNDSIVSVESTRVAGMAAHKVLPVTHSFMMRNNEVIDNTIHFLKTGSFIPE
ncbi:MAG: alpha/beta hydrolase [Gammaproteobacteria bacterium]|jgi:hypothetical protein|nr:alpha/beta hydrolase [Gammaproteobacteria bacterium]HJN96717.1 alpha/beta hydrolase [Gammaproteobacteria bacterium]|tara:strand:- start:22647 stop:23354 length:708 start_codon:yes stop_codon:yes gene_type:complete